MLAEEAKTIAEWHDKCANKCADIATVLRDTRAGQEQLVREADAKIASAKLPGEAEALVTQYHGIARYQTEAGVTAAMASHTSFKKSTENTRALDLLTKWGDVPAPPPASPSTTRRRASNRTKTPTATPRSGKPGLTHQSLWPTRRPIRQVRQPRSLELVPASSGDGRSGWAIRAARGPVTQPTPGMTSSPAASALGGAAAVAVDGRWMGGGGMGSGGGIPKMPGGLGSGGMPGMGSNPAEWRCRSDARRSKWFAERRSRARCGQRVAVVVGVQPGNGDDSGDGRRNTVCTTSSPSESVTGPIGRWWACGTPGVGGPRRGRLAGRGAAGHGVPSRPGGCRAYRRGDRRRWCADDAAAGFDGSPSRCATPGTDRAGGHCRLDEQCPGSARPVRSECGCGPDSDSGQCGRCGSDRSRPGAPRVRRRRGGQGVGLETAARRVHGAQSRGGVGCRGVPSPSGTETVITSNDGSSYIPAGVFVPRSVRVLATDPLVDDYFRQRWFGWGDPARVLVEYAQLRAQWGWKLVAAATTAGVSVLRDAGVEHPPSCSGDTNPLLQQGVDVPAPVLDDMHVHRLAVLWPEVYPRLLRIMDADPLVRTGSSRR